ncbi:transposable element-related [Anaeramoeba flamelloides]|uniref:Transposable element-related n=1 Tax=Anaeramoeba flamelloides TaxID=1746091 RepID=A0ABQ8XH51_9EUKA|nr:transposable element-related [Anaeramoeba flamelloides]
MIQSLEEINEEIKEKSIRVKIIELRSQGWTRKKISEQLLITIKKVRYWEKKFNTTGPLLSERQKEKRLLFAKHHLEKNTDWQKVVFSDETWFYLEGSCGKIWRQWGELEDSVFENLSKFSPKVMFFGGIAYDWISTLIKCPKRVNAESYRKCLVSKCGLFTGMDNLHGKKNWLLMQDGAPAHTAKTTITYLEKKCNILQNWPANSPDLNPIENLWGIMSRRLNEIDIKTVKNLEKVVREVWKNIDWLMIENLINSMERRLKLVVQLKGDCINGYL